MTSISSCWKDRGHAEQARQLTPATACAVAGDQPFTGHMLDLPKGESDATIQ
jgi:hypothetical protein